MDNVDSAQGPGTSVRSSGIPTVSRLPTIRSRPTATPNGADVEEPIVSKPARPSIPTPRLQKRSSIASFSTTSQGLPKPAPVSSKPQLSQVSRLQAPKPAPKASTVARPGSIAVKTNLQRPASVISKRSSTFNPGSSTKSKLPSNGRTASRQGNQDDSSIGSPDATDDADSLALPRARKASRPSISDRTVESLHTLPATPKDRRKSSFFNPVSPMGPPPRPMSSLSRNGSVDGRPGTSDGTRPVLSRPTSPDKRMPHSAIPSRRTSQIGFGFNPSKSVSRKSSLTLNARLQEAQSTAARGSSPARPKVLSSISTNKTTNGPAVRLEDAPKIVAKSESREQLGAHTEGKRAVSNSSAALREQIAAAKAAARREKMRHDSPQNQMQANGGSQGADFDMHADPFNQAPKDEKHILKHRINKARMDGRLNIAAMGLKELPIEVRKMYDAAAMEESKVNWAEVVDLTRFIAADNALEGFDDDVFPDVSADELAADDTTEGNQFGGLELLDLHGNIISSIPLGLRRLERLTTLNLARNKLDNAALEVIAQIHSLKELRLGHNALTGNLPHNICGLKHLETLDLQSNRLLGLPQALADLTNLRVLNVSGNQLTTVPMDALLDLPIIELDASSNALLGPLFPLGGIGRHPTLQNLNVANNSLAALIFSDVLDLPSLQSLNITNNHITILPSLSGWTELVMLMAGDNKLSELPAGFTNSRRLRHVNLTSNDLRYLDPEVSRMRSLETLVLAANPLRERKFLTMNAADIKRDLRARMAPADSEDTHSSESMPGSPITVVGAQDAENMLWTLRANGVLNLASNGLSDDVNDSLGSFLKSNEVKQLMMQSNHITCIPPALWLAQDLRVLDLSDNAFISADFLSAELSLPSLQELNLSRCRLSSLEPLTSHLQAPQLHTLNISANRLVGPLPTLRAMYPVLSTLLASDNRFESITADSLRGLHAVNLKSNDIQQLPAEIGLLWDERLQSLEVGSNAFRVPNYRILDKGTEATLRWLRDRLPADASETL